MRVPEFSGNINCSDQFSEREKPEKKRSALDMLRKKIKMIMIIKSAYSKDSKHKLAPMDK